MLYNSFIKIVDTLDTLTELLEIELKSNKKVSKGEKFYGHFLDILGHFLIGATTSPLALKTGSIKPIFIIKRLGGLRLLS